MRDCRLQRIEAVIERQQRVAPESDDDRLFLDGEHRRSRLFRSRRQVGDRGPPLPLRDGLLVDPIAFGQRPQALLTMLYRSTDRLCRRGAPVKNLAHSASFDSEDKDAPSKPGIKHLAAPLRSALGFKDLVSKVGVQAAITAQVQARQEQRISDSRTTYVKMGCRGGRKQVSPRWREIGLGSNSGLSPHW